MQRTINTQCEPWPFSGDTKLRIFNDYSFFTSRSYDCTYSQAVPGFWPLYTAIGPFERYWNRQGIPMICNASGGFHLETSHCCIAWCLLDMLRRRVLAPTQGRSSWFNAMFQNMSFCPYKGFVQKKGFSRPMIKRELYIMTYTVPVCLL